MRTSYLLESIFQFICFDICSTPVSGGWHSPEWMLAVTASGIHLLVIWYPSSGNVQAGEELLTAAQSVAYETPWENRRSDSRRHSTQARLQYKSTGIKQRKNTNSYLWNYRLTITLQEPEQCVCRQSRVSELSPPLQALNFFGFTRPHAQDGILC